VSLGVDDWELWSPWTQAERERSRSIEDWVAELFRRLPGLQARRLADLGSSLTVSLPATAVRFAEVVAVDQPEALRTRTPASRGGLGLPHGAISLSQLANGGRRFHAAVALDVWRSATRAEIDAVLRSVWCGLAEGGIVLITAPARGETRCPFDMFLGAAGSDEDPGRYHEIELQYLLRRAGFQGVRIRELRAVAGRTLVAMAVRRGLN